MELPNAAEILPRVALQKRRRKQFENRCQMSDHSVHLEGYNSLLKQVKEVHQT